MWRRSFYRVVYNPVLTSPISGMVGTGLSMWLLNNLQGQRAAVLPGGEWSSCADGNQAPAGSQSRGLPLPGSVLSQHALEFGLTQSSNFILVDGSGVSLNVYQ